MILDPLPENKAIPPEPASIVPPFILVSVFPAAPYTATAESPVASIVPSVILNVPSLYIPVAPFFTVIAEPVCIVPTAFPVPSFFNAKPEDPLPLTYIFPYKSITALSFPNTAVVFSTSVVAFPIFISVFIVILESLVLPAITVLFLPAVISIIPVPPVSKSKLPFFTYINVLSFA